MSDAHATISQLQNEKQALSRQLAEQQSRQRQAEEAHAAVQLLQRDENLALRNQLAGLTAELAAARAAERARAEEVASLQHTLLKVSAEFDRAAGVDPEDSAAAAAALNHANSTHVADAAERARLLAEKQSQLREAEARRDAQLAKEEALNRALLAEGGAAAQGNLAAVVTSLQESRQLLRLYQAEYARQETLDEAALAERYLLDHEAVAVRFARLSDRVRRGRSVRAMRAWKKFLRVEQAGRALQARRDAALLERSVALWRQELEQHRHAAAHRVRLLCRSAMRGWQGFVQRAREEKRIAAFRADQLQALRAWVAQTRALRAQRNFRARLRRDRVAHWFDAWRARHARVQRAQEQGLVLAATTRAHLGRLVLHQWGRALHAKSSLHSLGASKLRRAMLAWFGASRARKAQQLALVSLRQQALQRRARSSFHAWFLATQRRRLRALSDSNTLLSHDLGALSSQLRLLSQENAHISASLSERLYAQTDEAERNVEFEKQRLAYEANVKNEMALRDKIKQYELRSAII